VLKKLLKKEFNFIKMVYKILIFDLDGVLINTKDIHYLALNNALDDKYKISYDDHLNNYDGHSTNYKLNLLSINKNLPKELHKEIWNSKQKNTFELFNSELKYDEDLVNIFKYLQSIFTICIASNCIRKTIDIALSKIGIDEYIDFIVSNEDVKQQKPNSECFTLCVKKFNVKEDECLIFEDSSVGIKAAIASKCNVCQIYSPENLTFEFLQNVLQKNGIIREVYFPNLNVVIPMAGLGSRFSSVGYKLPKPLIDVNGITMIETVVNNLGFKANFTFIVQKEHEKFNVSQILNKICKNCNIIFTNGITDGAARTVLLSEEIINNDNELIIANSDQFLEWDPYDFLNKSRKYDACISIFKDTNKKWSFAKLDENGFVIEVAEKIQISDNATTGIYYWKHGKDFVKYAKQMIEKNIRTNDEFYVCPVFNEAILDGLKIKTYTCDKMWGLGTPEDLDNYSNMSIRI
jgi:HAD superfamily hydrolase (TIGR01509 family)